MAAYAAIVSVMHTIDQIQHHPHPPISLDNEQVELLTENITFLQDFLEGYSFHGSNEVDDSLESHIADAAHAIEDVIESHIVDQIHSRSAKHDISSFNKGRRIITHTEESSSIGKGKTIGCVDFSRGPCKASTHGKDEISSPAQPQILGRPTEDKISSIFYQTLQKVIESMVLIKKEVMEFKEMMGVQQLHTTSMPSSSSRSRPTEQNIMVNFDDYLYEMLDKLTGGQSDLQLIPVVGMGGIGKTTLTQNIFVDPHAQGHFDIRGWATISQVYSMREIVREVLGQENIEGKGDFHEMTENELGEKLHKHLYGRRYLIVLDDMWSISAWDDIKFFFPDNNNGSRILITTRLSNLASELIGSNYSLKLKLLDEDKSWNLFRKTLFNEEKCPLELEEIGKRIAKSCKGLPLSIVVVGGLLAKSTQTPEYWEYIAENINSIMNLEDDQRCFKILYMSYNQLPVHLKPCFLYMGVFPEDYVIRVSILKKLWAAEGFLKPIREKSLEEVAKEYLKDLIDRNLILVHKLGCTGNIKECKIHDLFRDLCLKEAQRESFYDVVRQPNVNIPRGIYTQRRILIPELIVQEEIPHAVQSESLVRSLIWDVKGVLPSLNFILLRIFRGYDKKFWYRNDTHDLQTLFQFVNLRYIAVKLDISQQFTSSVYFLWNLQTLVVDNEDLPLIAPVEIWDMPQLRHVEFTSLFLNYNIDGQDDVVLQNLQTLGTVVNLNCCEEVVKRIPNIKKLKTQIVVSEDLPTGYIISFDCLHKLESLCCSLSSKRTDVLQQLFFPHSLKKLTLSGYGSYKIQWEDMLEKIGLLPLLEKLILVNGSFRRREWETVEGQFCSLKFLKISLTGLENWATDSTHFPLLEHLVLAGLDELKEIPYEIGEIPTLKSIKLGYCRYSTILSAKRILEEQEELGEVDLIVRVSVREKNEAIESLTSPNFQIE